MPASKRLSRIGKVVVGVLIAGGCFLAGSYWAASPDAEDAESDRGKRRAAAQYQVSRSPLTMLEAVEHDHKSFDIFRKTQQAYVESPMVLMAALGAEGGKIGKLSVFQDMTSDGEQTTPLSGCVSTSLPLSLTTASYSRSRSCIQPHRRNSSCRSLTRCRKRTTTRSFSKRPRRDICR